MINSSQSFASPEAPATLALSGNCGYQILDNRIIVTIAGISNQRDSDDISGTLAIELWALRQPYNGGDFDGLALAGTSIGVLYGQHSLQDCRYDLIFQEPPAGTWYLTLMLREWTAAGYMTRDHINFALPYLVTAKPTLVHNNDKDNVINVSFAAEKEKAAATISSEKSPTPVAKDKVEKGVSKPAAAKPQAKPAVKTAEKKPDATAKEKIAQAKPATPTLVSLNNAARKEIAAIKGVSKKLAENIIEARPFKTIDDLLHVKGIGPKLLQKIRHFISL